MSQTKDIEIRAALHSKKLKPYRTAPDTIVIDELGLSHAKARIDVAVINGCVCNSACNFDPLSSGIGVQF